MSELHIEIGELIEAGTNIYDTDEAYREAKVRGYRLIPRLIERDPNGFLGLVSSWFDGEEVVAA